MFKHILIIDNFDSFTFNLVDYIEQQGCRVKVYRNDIDVDIITNLNPDLIILSPGPSVPKNAGNLLEIIDRYHDKYPIFGVCLGQEALIEYFGGTLKYVTPCHGKASPMHHDGKTIFSGLKQDFLAGRYHSLVGDQIPGCLEISAKYQGPKSEGSPCKESGDSKGSPLPMAIRHKKLPIEAVQFHPESVLTMKNDQGMKMMKNVISKNFTNV